jgi:hypothetical protein
MLWFSILNTVLSWPLTRACLRSASAEVVKMLLLQVAPTPQYVATMTVLMLCWESRRGFLCIARLHSARARALYLHSSTQGHQ